MTPEQIQAVAREIRLWRRQNKRTDAAGFMDALAEICLDGSSLTRAQRDDLHGVRMSTPGVFAAGPGDDAPPDYALDICGSMDELDEAGEARTLPPDVQALWDADEAGRQREEDEH